MREPIGQFVRSVQDALPRATLRIDVPSRHSGHWVLEVRLGSEAVTAEWRATRGFTLAARAGGTAPADGNVTGERFDDPHAAAMRVVALLCPSGSTSPPRAARSRKPRIKPPPAPTERPLDDGARDGTEVWRVVDGVEFCHWDRWLLRLALTEPEGLASIAREFWARRKQSRARSGAEAMLAQLADLEARLARVSRTPTTLLDAEEQASEWLRNKAFKRVWHSRPHAQTRAMRQTPRRRLNDRALRGHWTRFRVSPMAYYPALRSVAPAGPVEHWLTGHVARALEDAVEQLARSVALAQERLAVYRAAVTVFIETMDQVDDSGADMAMVFERIERAWLPLVREALGDDGVLRDVLELAVWEDYGLLQGVEDFLRALPEDAAARALGELREMIAELEREELEYQLEKACALQRVVLARARH